MSLALAGARSHLQWQLRLQALIRALGRASLSVGIQITKEYRRSGRGITWPAGEEPSHQNCRECWFRRLTGLWIEVIVDMTGCPGSAGLRIPPSPIYVRR